MTDTALELAMVQLEESPTIVVPVTGQLVDLTQPLEVAAALQDIREVKRQLDELRAMLEAVIRLEAQRQGTKTLHLGRLDAVVSGGQRVEYDASELMAALYEAGLSSERVTAAITPIVTFKVDQRLLRQFAAANPAYKTAIDAARTTVETPWRVTVKPTGRDI